MTVIPVSTVPSALAYLNTEIAAAYADDPLASQILVTFIDPGDGPDVPNDIIALGEVVRTVEPVSLVGSGGQGWLNEEYEIECTVSSWTGSGPEQGDNTIPLAMIARAWQLVAYVETAIRTDPSLGDLVNVAYPMAATAPVVGWTEKPVGLAAEITFRIHVSNLA